MEHYKISKLLKDSSVSKFVAKKRVEVNDLPSDQYSSNKGSTFKTSMLRSYFCDYTDAYIVVNRLISATDTNANNIINKKLTFKNKT